MEISKVPEFVLRAESMEFKLFVLVKSGLRETEFVTHSQFDDHRFLYAVSNNDVRPEILC